MQKKNHYNYMPHIQEKPRVLNRETEYIKDLEAETIISEVKITVDINSR